MSPVWSRVVKVRQHIKHVTVNGATTLFESSQREEGKWHCWNQYEGIIQVIKTKLLSVFATKFSPDLDSETLASFSKDKLCPDVTCQKIDTAQSRFSSFKITSECNKVGEMYEAQQKGILYGISISQGNSLHPLGQWM